MAEASVISSLASCVVTVLIRKVITCTQSAKHCKSECQKLEKELKVIEPDVEKIEKRLALLRRTCNDHHEDLKMVEDWLERLKDAILLANIEVHKCNSCRYTLSPTLSARITSTYKKITKAAENRVTHFLMLRDLFIPGDRPAPWYESPGEAALFRRSQGRNEPLRPEDLARFSMSSSSSHNGSYGFPGFFQDSSHHSSESSSFPGEDSSGYKSSGSSDLQRMSQQRNEILEQEDQTRLSLGHSHQLERRHTTDSSYATQHQHYVPSNNSSRMSYPAPWNAS